jgi:hypothetical protein
MTITLDIGVMVMEETVVAMVVEAMEMAMATAIATVTATEMVVEIKDTRNHAYR